MLPLVSFFKINLWVAILLALTLFSGSCVEKSMGFTAPKPATPTALPQRYGSHQQSVGNAFSGSSPTCLASTVTDTPTKTEKKIEIVKEDATEDEAKNGKNGWEIQLYNDPFNHRTFVAKCLCEICGKTDTESYQIMMQAHKNG